MELAVAAQHRLAACSWCRPLHCNLTLQCAYAEDSAEEEAAAPAAKPTRAGVKRGRTAAKHAGDYFVLFILARTEALSTIPDRRNLLQFLLAVSNQSLARQIQGVGRSSMCLPTY